MEAIGDAPGIGGPNYCEVCHEESPGQSVCPECRAREEAEKAEREFDRVRDEE